MQRQGMLTIEELQELAARMPNARRTAYGSVNVQTEVVSRSKKSTYIVTDEPDGQNLRAELQASGHRTYAETMKTVVPIVTWLNSHSASEMCIRMQPCEAE